jgi:hypothetical protein
MPKESNPKPLPTPTPDTTEDEDLRRLREENDRRHERIQQPPPS